MNSKISIYKIVVSTALIAVITGVMALYLNRPKIMYVRSQELVEKFQGTIEARANFERSKNSLTANVDSLKLNFDRARMQYLNNAEKMSVSQRTQQEKLLGQQQGQLIQYSQAIEEKIQEEDNKMMQEVLNQINSFVEEYAESNGYDLILGTTLSGNLLYGKDEYDITAPLLKKLNEQYKGKQ